MTGVVIDGAAGTDRIRRPTALETADTIRNEWGFMNGMYQGHG